MATATGASVQPLDSPPPYIRFTGIDQHLGFDKDYIISTGDMSIWWASSPYYEVGIYLPGSPSGPTNAPTKLCPKRILLDSDWIETVAGQGWGFIPIWSGLQAPCAMQKTLTNFFSSDPSVAETQGRTQAVKAYNSATNLGLGGSIIYVDIEEFDNSICGPAVRGYVRGWIEKMHDSNLGGSGSAGIYGGGDNAKQEFAGADDVYIAGADNRVTVWHLNHGKKLGDKDLSSGLPDTPLWSNKERIRQYNENVYEKWGATKISYKIDDDLVDATVVQSSGTKQYTFIEPTTSDYPGSIIGIANGVNDGKTFHMGPVVGSYFNGSGDTDSVFIYASYPGPGIKKTGVTTVSTPADGLSYDEGFAGFQTLAINNLGQVAGSYESWNEPTFSFPGSSFLYSPGGATGTVTPLPNPPDAISTYVFSINDAGWIVGWYYDSNYTSHCMIYKPPYAEAFVFESLGGVANCSDLDIMDSMYIGTNPLSINGLGQIAGTVMTPDPNAFTVPPFQGISSGVSFVIDAESSDPGPSSEAQIVFPAASHSFYTVTGLNNNGQLVGNAWCPLFIICAGCPPPPCNTPPYMNFLINPDGSLQVLDPFGGSSLNDDVQMTDWDVITYPQS